MIICFDITYTGELNNREFNRAKRDAFYHIGVRWHRDMRPKHFTKEGAREYGYKPRKGERGSGRGFKRSYTARKLKIHGHTLPLVFSGESRSLSAVRRIKATSNGVTIRMHAPSLNRKHAASEIVMREELTTISAAEEKRLLRAFHLRLVHNLRTIRGTPRTKRVVA